MFRAIAASIFADDNSMNADYRQCGDYRRDGVTPRCLRMPPSERRGRGRGFDYTSRAYVAILGCIGAMRHGLLKRALGEKSMLTHIHIALVGLAVSTAMADQTGLTVPSSLLVAASQSPVEFAMALAYASIPSGLEIKESDDVPPSRPPAFDIDPQRRVALDDLVTTFNVQHRDYRAVVMRGGVIVVRPIDRTLSFLDKPSSLSQEVTVTGVMAAARHVFAAVDPGLTGPVLNSIGRKVDNIPVVLDGTGGRTVIDTLNQIVTQAPGCVWVVTTRDQQNGLRVIGFGFIQGDGSRRTQPMRDGA